MRQSNFSPFLNSTVISRIHPPSGINRVPFISDIEPSLPPCASASLPIDMPSPNSPPAPQNLLPSNTTSLGMATHQPPPQQKSARLRGAQSHTTTQTIRPTIHLPLDVLYSIFEFYILDPAFDPADALIDRQSAKSHHKGKLRFAHVCRDWKIAATRNACYTVHDDADVESSHRPRTNGPERLRNLRKILASGGNNTAVTEFAYKSLKGSLKDTSAVVKFVNTVKTTLTSFRLHIWSDGLGRVDDDTSTNGDKIQHLSHILSRVDGLTELEMHLELAMIPFGEIVHLLSKVKTLRKCYLDLQFSYPLEADGKINWRNLKPSSTPWHQLTTLTIRCSSLTLPIIPMILSSGTVTHLEINGCERRNARIDHSAFDDLWSAMEVHCASLTSFIFDCPSSGELFPTLDRVIPFLKSCNHLEIQLTDLNTIGPLLSLPKLTRLKLSGLPSFRSSDTGIKAPDLLAFLPKVQGVLKIFELTSSEVFGRSREASVQFVTDLKEEARRSDITFYAHSQ